MIARLWAFLTFRKAVVLIDCDGEESTSIAYCNSGKWKAKRHWPFNIYSVVLEEGGAVSGARYVVKWKYPK